MNDPTPESLALVDGFDAVEGGVFGYWLPAKYKEELARRIDAHVAERTAGAIYALSEQALDDILLKRLALADEMAEAAEYLIARVEIALRVGKTSAKSDSPIGAAVSAIAAYRALSLADPDPCKIRVSEPSEAGAAAK